MRKYALAILQVTTFLCIFICGCSGPSTSEVAGTYRRNTAMYRETIRLCADQTYTQDVMTQDGSSKFSTSGRWTLQYKQVSLDNFYITYDVEHREEMKKPVVVTSANLIWNDGWLVKSEEGPYVFEKSK